MLCRYFSLGQTGSLTDLSFLNYATSKAKKLCKEYKKVRLKPKAQSQVINFRVTPSESGFTAECYPL